MIRGDRKLRGKPRPTLNKHDILYSRARSVLNQRYIKRPWFNLNPFLERMDEHIDLEKFEPDESKYIQKLESLVLCENYTCDYPLDTRELTIGMFFPYLYSHSWDDGISIRILEGQLLDQLLLSLNMLERTGSIVRHKTYAFARNQRQRTGCYKLVDKEATGHIDETLLIEFTYYGELDKDEPNEVRTNPLEYLKRYKEMPPQFQGMSQTNQPKEKKKGSYASVDNITTQRKKSVQAKSEIETQPVCPRDRGRSSAFAKAVNVIRFTNAMQSVYTSRRTSLPLAGQVPFLKTFTDDEKQSDTLRQELPSRFQRRKTYAAASKIQEFDIEKSLKRALDDVIEYETLAELEEAAHAKLEEATLKTDDSKTKGKKRFLSLPLHHDPYYGDELYLNDPDLNGKRPLKAHKILKRKQFEFRERRLQRHQLAEEQDMKIKELGMRTSVKSLSDFKRENEVHYSLNLPEKCPTFEEFVKLLKDEEHVPDPRYKHKEKPKTVRKTERIQVDKEKIESKVTDSAVDVETTASRKSVQARSTGKVDKEEQGKLSLQSLGSRGTVRLPPIRELGVNIGDKTKFADEVLGVTDSEPCKDHCLKILTANEKDQEAKAKRDSDRVKLTHKRNQITQPDGISLSAPRINKVVTESKTLAVSAPRINKVVNGSSTAAAKKSSSPLFSRASLDEDIAETPDSVSEAISENGESSVVDSTVSSFDIKKLKINYSLEKLRKKRRKARKKPAFFEILKKYYRAQAALRAFRRDSFGIEQFATGNRGKRFSIGRFSIVDKLRKKPPKEEQSPPTPPVVLGKLKHFKFLDIQSQHLNRIRLDEISKVDFSTPKYDNFEKLLEQSLKDFVVRREIVASDRNARCATSITFTRKQSFKAKK